MDVDDASRSHAAEMIGWVVPLGHAPRAGGWYGHQSALADPAGCGAFWARSARTRTERYIGPISGPPGAAPFSPAIPGYQRATTTSLG